MNRCTRCVLPQTRPDTHFTDGVCSACLSYEKRPTIDWEARQRALEELLDRHHGRCIVPSSGGKDSTYQALTLLAMGADVTLVTATTCHLTPIGRHNIDNLARYARTIEVTPNRTVRAKLNRLGLEMVGDISWPEHVSIFTTPFRAAAELGIPLIFYGENPQNQYGGPPGADEAATMTKRWRSEFGGFLGLRPQDLIGKAGLTARDMADYEMPAQGVVEIANELVHHDGLGGRELRTTSKEITEAHFLGQYIEWDSARNTREALKAGMLSILPTQANWWAGENLDNAQTGIHDHMMYRKFGYGRGCAQISVDVRRGTVTREQALEWVAEFDGLFPPQYARITIDEILDRIGMSLLDMDIAMNQFTNWHLFDAPPTVLCPRLRTI